MDIVAQWVRTAWTKQSRGGEAAARRNAMPIAFPVPEAGTPILHEIDMAEWDDFDPRFTLRRELPDPSRVSLRPAGRLLSVELVPEPDMNPSRWYRGSMVLLAPGQWLRWQINYRIAHLRDGEWSYRLDTLNLAFGAIGVFGGTPSRFLDERTHLY
ncbi:hypothetical protein FB565_004755 [Actinoplanes lutulentus]|nr:hypothetical protein [Actinoplanes lutulentus]MBB2945022.1 hypothetical protein [Actinoplanes lutulentus]